MKIITVANQKGGVAKTTTTASFGYELVKRGFKVLLIDLDPQGDLTYYFDCDVSDNAKTMYDVLCGSEKIKSVLQKIDDNFFIAPSDLLLAGAEQEMNKTGKEYKLKESLEVINKEYDYIIIDTPPALGILTVNAFTAADEIIIPSNAGVFSTKAFVQLANTMQGVKKYFNSNLCISGILITRYNPHTKISKAIREMAEKMASQLNTKVFGTYIRTAIAVEEAQYEQVIIDDYSGKSTVTQDYKSFVDEYLKSDKES